MQHPTRGCTQLNAVPRLVSTTGNQGWRRVKSPAKDCLPSRPLANCSTISGFVAQIEAVYLLRRLPFTTQEVWGPVGLNVCSQEER